MRRRRIIAGTGVTLSAITGGCLGIDNAFNNNGGADNGSAEIEYDQCTEPFIPFSELPREPRNQVETAVEEGDYTTSDVLYYPELVGEESVLWIEDDNRYYEHRTEGLSDGETALTFEEITPTRETPAEIKLSNQTEDTVTVGITISSGEGETFVDKELTTDPAEDIDEVDDLTGSEYAGEESEAEDLPGFAFPKKLQEYDISVTLLEGESKPDTKSKTETVSIDPWSLYYWIQISADEILMGTVQDNDGIFTEYPDSKTGLQWECTNPPDGWPEKSN